MKKILLSFFAFTIVSVAVFAQAPKMAMVEEFTQASCPPCETLNPLVSPFLKANTDKLVLLKYHTSWPGVDPMNEHNPDDVQARVDYYGVTGVPNLFVEGTEIMLDQNRGWEGVADDLQVRVNETAALTSPLEINVTHMLSADLATVNIQVEIKNVSADMFDATGNVAHVGLVEQEINFNAPPGSTSEQDFLMVMRKMVPSPNGTMIDNIPAGESIMLEMNDVAVPNYIYNYNQINVVAFVQNPSTRAIAQAGVSTPQALSGYGDVTATTNTQEPAGLCDYAMTPSVRISNDGAEEITSLDLSYSLNGGAPVTESWTGSLTAGQFDIISFPEVALMPPSTVLSYEITSVNGAKDINSLNNILETEVFYNLNATPTRSDFVEGVNISDFNEVPDNVIFANDPGTRVIVSVLASSFGAGAPEPVVGGFGNSDGSFMFDFYNSLEGEQGTIIFDKVDLSNSTMTELRFSHAYAQFSTENDKIEVVASTDCGVTWTSVWEMEGSALATSPPVSPGFFIPTSAQWRENTVDLSAYDGAPDFVLGFRATSGYGNFGYIDDVNLGSNLSSTYDASALEGNIEIFPNPVSTEMVINLQLETATPVTAEVYNMAGKKVATIEQNTNFPVGTHTLNWNVADQANGMYMVRILTEKGEISRKITVLK